MALVFLMLGSAQAQGGMQSQSPGKRTAAAMENRIG